MEIAQTGNTDLLVITGNPSDKELQDAWEAIVKRNSQGHGETGNYMDNIKDYARLLADYGMVKASLLQLMLVVDDECIAFLDSKGYRIDKSTATSYRESIQSAMQKCKNVNTKLASKHNQIMRFIEENKNNTTPLKTSAESMLAQVSAAIGFSVGIDTTLARYNEYCKIIKKKIEAQKSSKRNAA